MGTGTIAVTGLVARYQKDTALKAIDLEVGAGEVVAVVGPEGCGKSTLLKCLVGLVPAAEGEMQMDGLTLPRDAMTVRRRIGYLAETNPVYDKMTVHDQLTFIARLRELPDHEEEVKRVSDACGLQRVMARPLKSLERGVKQRFGLAQALLGNPKFLLLDAPTRDLEPEESAPIRAIIATLPEATTIVTTRTFEEALMLGHRLVVLNKGKVAAEGTPDAMEAEEAAKRRIIVAVQAPERRLVAEALEALKTVKSMEGSPTKKAGVHVFELQVEPEGNAEEQITAAVEKEEEWELDELRTHRLDLNTIYKRLTGG